MPTMRCAEIVGNTIVSVLFMVLAISDSAMRSAASLKASSAGVHFATW